MSRGAPENETVREAIQIAMAWHKVPSEVLDDQGRFDQSKACAFLDQYLPPQQERLAVHEAGHAVVAHALGQTVLRVGIDPGIVGEALIHWTGATDDRLRDRITFSVASFVAELLLFGIGRPGRNDWDKVNRDAFDHGGCKDRRTDCVALVKAGEPRAEEILRRNEATLRRLAVELVKHRVRDGEPLPSILADVTRTEDD
jgi:hypothetical protein